MNKIIIGAVIVILVATGAVFVWKTLPSVSKPTDEATTTPPIVTTSTYATTTFSVTYPPQFTADAGHVYDQVNPAKPIYGVRFTIPVAMATGTNLSSDSYVSIEQLPRARMCTGDIYLAANVKAKALTENGVNYSVASSSDAGAGNRYEEIVYALADSSPCIAVRYFIHYGAIGNYPAPGEPGSVSEFDRTALLAAFDSIRTSLTLTSTPAAAPTSTTTSSTTTNP